MLLYEELEYTRSMLYDVLERNDRETALRISQELDELIVKYYFEIYYKR